MNKVKLIAELGWNHMGDMELAKDMIHAASESGATFAKVQTWKVSRLCPGPWDQDGRREIYESAELSNEDHMILRDYCEQCGIQFMTSVFCPLDLEFVSTLCNEIKIPSPESYNNELVNNALRLFDHLYMSTGASRIEEYARWATNEKITLLHCVSSYPCNMENINLYKFDVLKAMTPRIGYSGHLKGTHDAIAAICKGSQVVEKHFTIDNGLPGRDNKFALLPHEFKEIATFADNFEMMNINKGLDLQPCEMDYRTYQKGRWNH